MLERASCARNSRIVTALSLHGPACHPAQLMGNSPGFGSCSACSARNSRATHTSFPRQARFRLFGAAAAFNPGRPAKRFLEGAGLVAAPSGLRFASLTQHRVSRSPETRCKVRSPRSAARTAGRNPALRGANERRRAYRSAGRPPERRRNYRCTARGPASVYEMPEQSYDSDPTNRRRSRRHGLSCLGFRGSHALL